MKFTITSITEEGPRGKTDNPHRKPTMEQFGWHSQNGFDDEPSGWQIEGGEEAYYELLDIWQEAEANRKEYEINHNEYKKDVYGYYLKTELNPTLRERAKLGARIEGDIKDNQIINIKIL